MSKSNEILSTRTRSIVARENSISNSEEWKCRECGYANTKTDTKCMTCDKSKPARPIIQSRLSYVNRSPSPKIDSDSKPSEQNSSIYPDLSPIKTSTTTKLNESSKHEHLNRDSPFIAYIPNLPADIDDSNKLEKIISDCLERRHRQKIVDIQCFTELGIGVVYLETKDDQHHLIHEIEDILIKDSKDFSVSFVKQLELISYVVIQSKDMKDLPLPNDVSHRWTKLYKSSIEPECELLSIQFPNIFKITTNSLDELINALSVKEFRIGNQLATVYFYADYCFLEDLPRTTTEDRLKQAIENQTSDKCVSKEFMHIQYNKDADNAIVITSGQARIWSPYSTIELDKRTIRKKNALACRLLVEHVPKDFSPLKIVENKIFENSKIKIIPSTEHVILELDDRIIYEKCINQGALRIDNHLFGMRAYTSSSAPEDSEINAETWYSTEMCGLKSDIMQFMSDPNHHIFRRQWNAQAFLDEFRHWLSPDPKARAKDMENFEKESNNQRHLLRMTVMLNTIGIVKKGYYRIGDKEIKLKSDRLKTYRYDHNSRLKRSTILPLSEAMKTLYPSTKVTVVKDDCLLVYKKLVSDGYRPVLLNMANATSPGGGYKRGDGAQEETIFRRSNYYQSLDMKLDENQASARFYCSSNYEFEPFDENDKFYPMDEFGAIYTSGLTVFRLPEETGYQFMEIPMQDVCAIAMAAHRDPELDNKHFLKDKYSISTRKKIENIFAIAYHHRHDCLVLSAFGCGAFRNPPTHIASIFKSVIEQYAGFFKCIYFSVLDDHNAGHELNPDGNYEPFRNILNNLDIKPQQQQQKTIDMTIGPRRILRQLTNTEVELSDIRICYLKPCHFGGKCSNMNDSRHSREYSHPPLCPYVDNQMICKDKNDKQHKLWFRHRQRCKYGGECELNESDLTHSNEYEHPIFCPDGGKCDSMDSDHLKEYRHLPLCRFRRECTDYNRRSSEHCQNFRHCIPMCSHGAYCIKYHDEKHFQKEKHPFQPPCPFTPFHCRYFTRLSESKNTKELPTEVQNHCSQYSHVCRFGRDCREKAEIHWKTTIHIARHYCPAADQCKDKRSEEHLNSFTHSGIPDIRLLCQYGAHECRERRNAEHILRFRHDGNHDRSGVISSFGQNRKINFTENQQNIIETITNYAKNLTSTRPLSIPIQIQKLVKSLQPIHRCGKLVFESILVHGNVMSHDHMEHLKHPSFVSQAVQEHKIVRAIIDGNKMNTLESHAKTYIQAIVSREYNNKYAALAAGKPGGTPVVEDDVNIRVEERILNSTIEREAVETIRKCATDIAEASWNLTHNPTGLNHPPDKILGTDKHIFSILGPNLGHYYGDIFIVFKRELMLHPDTNFSLQAATSFLSGRTFTHRTWVKDPGNNNDRVKCFHESKLHCSIPGYEYAAAAELMAMTGLSKNTMDVRLKDIFERWRKVDSHEGFEAHLPQLVPLDYIDEIYIPKNLFDSLTPAAQESAKKIFGNAFHITNHTVNLTPAHNGGSRPNDKDRADYQDFIITKLLEKFEKQIEYTNNLSGIFITLAPSKFTNHIVLPLTIDGAYNQYRQTHKHVSTPAAVYIYWQAMYGDIMITLSDEQIDPDTTQTDIRCLVCYIAERPSTTITNYHESYSYLNAGDPYKHDLIMSTGRCSAYSGTFHRGCNIEDFLTYCLKFEKKTGEVTLCHAGSNGIYSYETISYQFPRTTLDLNKLNYIHVSAGSQKVPIRNLIVSFEQISDLHPTFDKDFKGINNQAAAAAIEKRKKQVRERKSSSDNESKSSSEEKSPSIGRKIVNVFGNLLGFGGDTSKKLEPCPDSENCLLQDSAEHIKQKSHPCPYSELCAFKDQEPHLTHEPRKVKLCSTKGSCNKLSDPDHRAKYRHQGFTDFLKPCTKGNHCSDKSLEHRINYSHNKDVEMIESRVLGKSSRRSLSPEAAVYNGGENDRRTPCRHGSSCWDQKDATHCAQYSHPNERESKASASSNSDVRIPCRHGSNCWDKNDTKHCSQYSHPSNESSNRIPCRYGSKCWDKKNSNHCKQYSHPDD